MWKTYNVEKYKLTYCAIDTIFHLGTKSMWRASKRMAPVDFLALVLSLSVEDFDPLPKKIT